MSDVIKAPEVNVWAEADSFHVELEFETDVHRAEVEALRAQIAALTARLAQAERVVEAAHHYRKLYARPIEADTAYIGERLWHLVIAVDALDGTAGPAEPDGEAVGPSES